MKDDFQLHAVKEFEGLHEIFGSDRYKYNPPL
jgi:hypothetical protein